MADRYLWGTHAAALAAAEGVKSRTFPSAAAALVVVSAVSSFVWAGEQRYDNARAVFVSPLRTAQGSVPPFTVGAAQADPSQIAPSVWKSAAAPVVGADSSVPLRFIWGTQEALDLSISGWTVGGTQANQGPVPPSILIGQIDPSQLQPQVWRSVATPPQAIPNPVAAFFSIPPQTEDRPTQTVWRSLVAGKTPPVIPTLWAAPQQVDFTQQALFTKPGLPTGPVPPITSGVPQTDPGQIAPNLWKSVATPPVAPGPPRFVWGTQESHDLSIGAWAVGGTQALQGPVPATLLASQENPSQIPAVIWKSAVTPPALTGAVPIAVTAGPQADATQIAAQVWKAWPAAPVTPNPAANFLSVAPQQAGLTQQGWILRAAPVKQGPVPPLTIVPVTDLSQTLGYQIPAKIFVSAATPPAAPPNLRKLYLDVTTGRLYWQVSQTSNPTLIIPL